MNNFEIIITISALMALLIVVAYYFMAKDKKQVPQISSELINSIVTALGGIDNVNTINKEHQRIKIGLNDPKQIDQQAFKNLEISAFLVSKELKILVKQNSEQVYQKLVQLKSGDKK